MNRLFLASWIRATALAAAFSFTGVAVIATTAQAELVLPRLSPVASVMQSVGVTDVTVEYSSPGAKGRTVFGDLVPYGELWRTGANAATKITFSTDATVGGIAVPAGTYAIFAIPGEAEWTVALNKNYSQGGTRGYDAGQDQARFKVKSEQAPARERMTFIFSETTDDSTRLDLEWAGVRVSIPIQVETSKLAMANIEAATKGGWRDYANAARYVLDTKGNADQGIRWADMALAIEDTWYTNFIKAQLLAAKGDFKKARELAQKAYDQGKKDSYFFWESQVAKALEDWKGKK